MMSASCFLQHPETPFPDKGANRPGLSRRRMIMGFGLIGTGIAGGVFVSCHKDEAGPVTKPGPRRYPPAYWADEIQRKVVPQELTGSGGRDNNGAITP
jgi:hypothetical protein